MPTGCTNTYALIQNHKQTNRGTAEKNGNEEWANLKYKVCACVCMLCEWDRWNFHVHARARTRSTLKNESERKVKFFSLVKLIAFAGFCSYSNSNNNSDDDDEATHFSIKWMRRHTKSPPNICFNLLLLTVTHSLDTFGYQIFSDSLTVLFVGFAVGGGSDGGRTMVLRCHFFLFIFSCFAVSMMRFQTWVHSIPSVCRLIWALSMRQVNVVLVIWRATVTTGIYFCTQYNDNNSITRVA